MKTAGSSERGSWVGARAAALGAFLLLVAGAAGKSAADTPAVLTEDDVVREALVRNPEILSAAALWDAQKAGNWEATSNMLPHAVGAFNTRRNDKEIAFDGLVVQPKTQSTWTFDVTQPVFRGGTLWQAKKIAGLNRDAAESDLSATRGMVSLRAREAVYELVQSQGEVQIAEETLAQLQENKRVVDRMFEVGSAPRADVLRIDASLAAGEQALVTAQTRVRLSQATINVVMNRDLATPVQISEGMELPDFDLSLEAARDRARTSRPELRAIDLRADAADRSVTAARGSLLPTVGAQFHYQKDETDLAFSSTESWWIGGVAQLEIPLGLGNFARVQRAKANAASARRGQESSINGVLLEVEAAYSQYEVAKEGLDLAARQLAAAEESYRQVQVRYRNGEAAQVDLLDAQTRLTTAKVNQLNQRVGFRRAVARMHRAMGDDALAN